MADDREKSKKDLEQAALFGAAGEVIGRFGSAVKEHITSYSGRDNETGEEVKRSLKSVAKSKVDSQYEKTNIKQQAGFSAEIKAKAKDNAEAIIKGQKKRTMVLGTQTMMNIMRTVKVMDTFQLDLLQVLKKSILSPKALKKVFSFMMLIALKGANMCSHMK